MDQKWILPTNIEHNGLIYSFTFVAHGQIRMKVTGSGAIPGKDEHQPWLRYKNKISELWIDEGITKIGSRAFAGYGWLERVWLPGSVRELGYLAFSSCPKLQEITYSGSIEQLQSVMMANALPEQFHWEE